MSACRFGFAAVTSRPRCLSTTVRRLCFFRRRRVIRGSALEPNPIRIRHRVAVNVSESGPNVMREPCLLAMAGSETSRVASLEERARRHTLSEWWRRDYVLYLNTPW